MEEASLSKEKNLHGFHKYFTRKILMKCGFLIAKNLFNISGDRPQFDDVR